MPFGGALTTGLIGAGTSLLGGIFGSSAAKKAAQQQQENIAKGQAAITSATGEAKQGVKDAVSVGNDQITTGTAAADSTLADVFNQQKGTLQPYLAAGNQGVQSLMDFYKDGGAGTQQFSFNPTDLQNEPGYQFQLQQGTEALGRRAAAGGASSSGGTLASLMKYGQGLASTSYQAAYDRALKTFQTNRDNTLAGFTKLAGLGQTATQDFNSAAQNYGNNTSTNQFKSGLATSDNLIHGADSTGNFGMQGAHSLADLYTQQGNAQAAGTVGSANAWTGALSGLGKTASGIYQTQTLKDIYSNGGGGGYPKPGSGYNPALLGPSVSYPKPAPDNGGF